MGIHDILGQWPPLKIYPGFILLFCSENINNGKVANDILIFYGFSYGHYRDQRYIYISYDIVDFCSTKVHQIHNKITLRVAYPLLSLLFPADGLATLGARAPEGIRRVEISRILPGWNYPNHTEIVAQLPDTVLDNIDTKCHGFSNTMVVLISGAPLINMD